MALLTTFKKPASPAPQPEPTAAAAPPAAPAPDAKRHAADDVPENFPGSYAPPAKQEVVAQAPTVAVAKDLDPRVARLRRCLLDTIAAVQAIDLPNFHAPDAKDIAEAPPAHLVSWAIQIARTLGCDGGAPC